MVKSYWEMERCGNENRELKGFDADIDKDLVRTFPNVQ